MSIEDIKEFMTENNINKNRYQKNNETIRYSRYI